MAVFREDANPWNQVDWRLLQNGALSLYLRPTILEEDLAWLATHAYTIDRFDCRTWTTVAVIHSALATALKFPAYYGENLDALNDCLSTLEIPDESGRVLVLEHFDVPARALSFTAHALLDIIAIQARQHLLFGRRLLGLVQTDEPELAFPPVGATPVTWNPREWLAAARGDRE